MRKVIPVLLIASVGLGACGLVRDSVVNPANWFGRSAPAAASESTEPVNPLIPKGNSLFGRRSAAEAVYLGTPFEEIVDLTVERVAGGAVVRATGRAAQQGVYEVRLTPVTEDETPVEGVLTYRLEGVRRTRGIATGTPASREVTAARKVTDQQLAGVRAIRVEGLENARITRR